MGDSRTGFIGHNDGSVGSRAADCSQPLSRINKLPSAALNAGQGRITFKSSAMRLAAPEQTPSADGISVWDE